MIIKKNLKFIFFIIITSNASQTMNKYKIQFGKKQTKNRERSEQYYEVKKRKVTKTELRSIQKITWARKKLKNRVCQNSIWEYVWRRQTKTERIWIRTQKRLVSKHVWRKSWRIKECMKIHERIKKILIQRFIVVRYNTQ